MPDPMNTPAKQEAKRRWPDNDRYDPSRVRLGRLAFVEGAEFERHRLIALLLSDKPVEEASAVMADSHDVGTTDCTRRALQAALDKVREGHSE